MNMAENTFNVGIIGYGFSAKVFHIPLLAALPRLKLYAIVQRSPKEDNDAEKDHPGIKAYRASEDLVKDEAVDVVIITTTPQTHFELTKLVLESGKHGTSIRDHQQQWANMSSCCGEAVHCYFKGSRGAVIDS